MIHVARLGFGAAPEQALQEALRLMEKNGYTILSVSVMASVTVYEHYEAFVVSRDASDITAQVSEEIMDRVRLGQSI